MRRLSCFAAIAMAIGCGDDDRPVMDAGPGADLAMMMDGDLPRPDMNGVDMGDAIDLGDDVDMGDEVDLGDVDMGDDVDMGMVDPSCTDGRRNGDETGTDCGGPTCEARCGTGAMCDVSADCASMACIAGTCQGTSCSDGIRNGMETGRDCGGPDCGGCGLGEACTDMSDCAMGMCTGGFCVADHCFNTTRDVNETDVDCGGPDCGPCMAGGRCSVDGDCSMGTCLTGFCRTAACTNGTLDAGEVDVDCGGECPGCDDGTSCTMDDDCLSNRCDVMVCTSCTDSTLNGTESDVDCGGTDCRPCFGGEACNSNSDCTSGLCTAGLCEGGAAYLDEDFSGGNGGWVAGGPNSSWEYGTPATANITGAFTGTMVWVTNATGNYNANEESWVESPSFDLSGTTNDPAFEAAIFHRTEACCDEWWLEVSTNGGTTWTKVVDDGTATGWYNDTANQWWDGDLTDWMMVSAVLTGTAGAADVKVRFRVSSDFGLQDEGFAFDDVRVFEDLCSNGILDAGEADIDCGGECGACADGANCVMNDDCASMRCDGGMCTSCSDGVQNGGEAAIDCGGGMCGFCAGGTPCTDGSICASGMCTGGVCDAEMVFYFSDFEADDGGLTVGGSAPSWAWGMPAAAVIDSAASGVNAWVTNLTGEYAANDQSYLDLPTLNLSMASSDPEISFNLWRDTESSFDGLWVEISTDGGTTYTKLVDDGTFAAWYNNPPSNDGWFDGTSSGYEPVSGILTGTAGEADVRVRLVFDSDGSAQNDGVAVDDLRIGPPAPDLAVSIAASSDLCNAGVVTVRNVGSAPVTFFDLTTVVDGSSTTDRIMVALEPGQAFNASISAMMSIEASVAANGDEEPANDSATFMTAPSIVVASGMRYLETFEMSDGGWTAGGANSDWEWGNPDAFFIGSADSGMNAWVTDLGGTYNPNQMSFLASPCMDMSALGADPTLSFSKIFETEPTNDHVYVEITTDGGISWSKLGAFGTGMSWYNDILGDFWDGRSGAADVWSRSSHPLTGAGGSAAVRFRFVMITNGSIAEDGFGVDDVIVQP